MKRRLIVLWGALFTSTSLLLAQTVKNDVVHYTGKTVATPSRHDGGLKPVVGVHSIQTMRAAVPWTYNHQPMIAFWNGKFYMHYLTDPRNEHQPPGKTMLQISDDGYTWSKPVELFPPYNVPDGFTKESLPGISAKNLQAVMHHRVGWYVYNYQEKNKGKKSQNKQSMLIAMGNYGIALTPKDHPNDGNGVGRVVRQVKKDGTFGPIYFIYYNHDFNEKNTDYPYYKKAKDKMFVKACDEILANPMIRMQWVEEADKGDPIIPLNKDYKAFSGYTLPDGRKVALWKHALQSVSNDGGNTWRQPVERAPGFVNSTGKIWGQRLSDGTYATVYNPAEYRWPLAISLSKDGLEYTTLSLVNGEVTPERHGGGYKNYGLQYVRGIQECNEAPNDGHLWVTYSNNKEDMWISRIPVPVRLHATAYAKEPFNTYAKLADMTDWNIYSPLFAPVTLDGHHITLADKDPYDYAKLERMIPNTKELEVEFTIKPQQNNHGELDIEFVDDAGNVCSRIVFDNENTIKVKGGPRYGTIKKGYNANEDYRIKAILSASLHRAIYYLNGVKACERQYDTPVESVSRIVFRTGMPFDKPDINTPADQTEDMPRADEIDEMAVFHISDVKTKDIDGNCQQVLSYDNYSHYADYFNGMEDENIANAIPNAKSSEWMRNNIPLFDCPQKNMEEMYYYRWWTLRKHIKQTPVGYGMTEFLIQRSYADKYNLIACAIGHHVMESRWLRDTTYLHQILRTWYFGNNGKPMSKMEKFSSWNPAAIFEAYKVTGDRAFLKSLMPSLENEYAYWKGSHQLKSGLYWQEDVRDGMEESISGARKKQYARPTINSYMYGNAMALSKMNKLFGDNEKAAVYESEATALKELCDKKLWNSEDKFYETLQGDTLARAREAIGFIPWYFHMPDAQSDHHQAWLQVLDEKGFSAPYGLTTAERRHPKFRSHGVGTCEWDGAIWPFASSQTLTAMANYLNDYPNPILTDSTFFHQMELYVESQHHRGRPYIGEYLDEKNGAWLMGDRERSRYYNHSTFNDLMITGIAGLRPQADGSIVVNPLIPKGKWDYFCLDGIRYHNHILTIVWDKNGQRYHQGCGLSLMIDGKAVANRKDLGKIEYKP